ncbi:hypothetical protein HPB49_012243 [Dermacentor silvarum]|uniref:Uncharacterized protein n=1 Tax=Dermacentor silvarum TaxID=543639 RepID=A0ACB8D581_DERSI|nr:hypothetical protein HPB49_012243 [Dermacentor silvarum]
MPGIGTGFLPRQKKGRQLAADIQSLQYTVVTDLTHSMRIGNSINIGNTPDLTLLKRASLTEWHNTGQTFGSDHCLLRTLITAGPCKRVRCTLSVTDWDVCTCYPAGSMYTHVHAPPAHRRACVRLETWTTDILADADPATKWCRKVQMYITTHVRGSGRAHETLPDPETQSHAPQRNRILIRDIEKYTVQATEKPLLRNLTAKYHGEQVTQPQMS